MPIVAFWAMHEEESGLTSKWAFAPAKGGELKSDAKDLVIKARRAFTPDHARESEITVKGLQLEARCKDIIRLTRQVGQPAPGNMMDYSIAISAKTCCTLGVYKSSGNC